jgi:hypothetical protein
MVLGSERIDASINADVANGKLWTLDKVRYLINGSIAEAAYSSCHRPSPSMSLAIFGVAVRSTRGSGPVSGPSRPGPDVRSGATNSHGLPLRPWRHSLAPVKSRIFFGRPVPLISPCPKIGIRPFGQEHFPYAAEVGAGHAKGRSRAAHTFARLTAGIKAAPPFP